MRAFAPALAALALCSPAAATGMEAGFRTPSGNIACEADVTPAQVRVLHCVVFSESGRRGQKTWSMRPTGQASVRFFVANIATEVPILRYGRTWLWHGVRCKSARDGLTCRNRSGHGWFLSRARQRTF